MHFLNIEAKMTVLQSMEYLSQCAKYDNGFGVHFTLIVVLKMHIHLLIQSSVKFQNFMDMF